MENPELSLTRRSPGSNIEPASSLTRLEGRLTLQSTLGATTTEAKRVEYFGRSGIESCQRASARVALILPARSIKRLPWKASSLTNILNGPPVVSNLPHTEDVLKFAPSR